ncbi:hypothetical protein CIPAW_06G050700 [Carya illinoinensis]|uniref:Uncharacterized protein n=1 Tax=Carya illinoinensis TaxID=32201 RepID=A0A8T1Q831_CARIL|nr:hypothetical protein CIPAW_06G050700 [Carya illinoinensis]
MIKTQKPFCRVSWLRIFLGSFFLFWCWFFSLRETVEGFRT